MVNTKSKMPPPIVITADEINCLIHSYLKDSGFQHSAFALRTEGRLEQSHHFSKHIQRGELVELLSKALLYVEVEAHWRGDRLSDECRTGFSLLERHVCSLEPRSQNATAAGISSEESLDTTVDVSMKRKASTPTDDGRGDKRARRDSEERDVSNNVEASKKKSRRVPSGSSEPVPSTSTEPMAKKSKSRRKTPAADGTDSDAVRILHAHGTEVFVCAWNPVALGQLTSGSRDAVINFWDVPPSFSQDSTKNQSELKPTFTLSLTDASQADLTSFCWSPDGTLMAVGSYDSVMRILTASGELYMSDDLHKGPIFASKFSPSGNWLLTASLDCTLIVWDVKAKKSLKQYHSHQDCCLDVDWLDESTFVSGGADGMIYIMSFGDTKPIKSLSGHENEVNSVRCNPSRTRLASCSDDGLAQIWDITELHNPASTVLDKSVVLKGHDSCIITVKWCPAVLPGESQLIATGSFDLTSRLWDSQTGECLRIFKDHLKQVYTLSFSPDGRHLATGAGDGCLYVYDVKAKEKRWSWFSGLSAGIFEIDWQQSDGASLIAVALEQRVVAIVDAREIPALQHGV